MHKIIRFHFDRFMACSCIFRIECEVGRFGVFCDGTCHCWSGSCDRKTGHCPMRCAAGWTDDNCQIGRCRCSIVLDNVS